MVEIILSELCAPGGGGGSGAALTSGSVTSGKIGNGAVVSGSVASGSLSDPHFASGAIIDAAQWSVDKFYTTAEPISGAKAVGFDASGHVQIAMAAIPVRMPAVGVVVDDVVSGDPVRIFHKGRVYTTKWSFSGGGGQPVFVGSSGELQRTQPTLSGSVIQPIGVAASASGLFVGAVPASGSVNEFAVGTGQIKSGHLASGFIAALGAVALVSGQVGSGFLASGSVQGFFGTTRHIASGTVGVFDFGSGAVIAGTVGSGAVQSANTASGSVGAFKLASGAANSGHVASGAIQGFFGATQHIASGTVGISDFGSGAVISGHVGSGTVQGRAAGGTFNIASGSVFGADLASGAVVSGHVGNTAVVSGSIASGSVGQFKLSSGAANSGHIASGGVLGSVGGGAFNIASGSVGPNDLGSGSVLSGAIASGQVSQFKLASGAVNSGHVGSGSVGGAFSVGRNIASGTVGTTDFGSGAVLSGHIGSGTVQGRAAGGSFNIASGSVFGPDLASGAVFSGHLGDGSVTSGSIASGQVGSPHIASGTQIDIAELLIDDNFLTTEPVSGGRAVAHTASGTIQIAMAAIPTRMPSVGVVVDNVLSGQVARVYKLGRVFSTQFSLSGAPAAPVFVGNSGELQVVQPTLSGSIVQALGEGISQSGFTVGAVPASGDINRLRVASGAVDSGHIQNAAVVSGSIASGSVSQFKLSSGATNSGHIGSGAVLGSVGGGAFTIASGSVGPNDLGSGSVLAGTIASGQVSQFKLASGAANSGHIGSGAVQGFFGATRHIASGTVGISDFGSGAVISGHVGSGAVQGRAAGGTFNIASGSVFGSDLASGGVLSGHISDTAVVSGSIASGSVSQFKLSSGAANSGHIGSGAVIGRFGAGRSIASGTVGTDDFGSGAVVSGHVGSGAVQGRAAGGTFNIASGSIASLDLASGAATSGKIGNAAVVSGSISSGAVDTFHHASGAIIDHARIAMDDFYMAEELISGSRAVAMSQSGQLVVAMAGLSGRMPAIGVVPENVSAASFARLHHHGRVTSLQFDFSGFIGKPLWVGLSGTLDTAPPAGVPQQIIAAAASQSGAFVGALMSGSPSAGGLTSGAVQSGHIASGAVQGFFGATRHIASGTVGVFDFGSGAVIAGTVGSGAVRSGNIASGGVGTFHVSSGTIVTEGRGVINTDIANTEETVSGAVAVQLSQSGTLRVAMASVSGRMPAIGVLVSGALSGQAASYRVIGDFQFASGLADYSGYLSQPLLVGRSGQVVTASGSWNSGGLGATDVWQQLGTVHNSGAALVNINTRGLTAAGSVTLAPAPGGLSINVTPGGLTSGAVASGHLASGAVQGFFGATRHIASGTVGVFDFGSGAVIAGTVGSGAVVSGNIASGQIGTNHFAANAQVPLAVTATFANEAGHALVVEDTGNNTAGELISGGRAVSFRSGLGRVLELTRIAPDGTFNGPAVGVVPSNTLSGSSVVMFMHGNVDSANFSFTQAGLPVFVGHSGVLTTTPLSGQYRQLIAITVSGPALFVLPAGLSSGNITPPMLAAKAVLSGHIGDAAVVSGNIGSGQIGDFHLASGAMITLSELNAFDATTLELISGGVAVALFSGGLIGRAMIRGNDPFFAAPHIGVVVDNISSGSVARIYQNGPLYSDKFNFTAKQGPVYVGHSGSIVETPIGGNVRTIIGQIASQSGIWLIGGGLGSGNVVREHLSSGAVGSGNIESGQVGTPHLASGSVISKAQSVIGDDLVTTELISGVKAVAFASGGWPRICRAERNSGLRLPAIGVTLSGAASGSTCEVVFAGLVRVNHSGGIVSGFHGQGFLSKLYVGSGGLIVNLSGYMGGASSGAQTTSGSVIQGIGYAVSGGMYVSPINPVATSGFLYSGIQGIW